MSYKEKPILKLYKYENNTFVLQAIIDDFMECSFERNLYQAGNFTISINYNVPNAQLFQRGLFVQFGNDPYDFGEIISISDAISSDGKGSQVRTITGYDSRYILKRRVIKNMNSNGLWVMTGKGEIVLRNLINDQCGAGESETKRQLPIINSIPDPANAIGKEYSVSEQFSNLYEVCKTIATQSEIGWKLKFDNSSLTLTLECYEGENRAQTVQFSTSFDSLANGQFTDSSDSYTNAIYVGGKGQNDDRDIYEGEDGTPSGLDRFESWDNQSNMTTEDEYEAEALAMLTQYGQTITVNGNGLAKCPYIYKEEYDVGDIITLAFSGKSAIVQILSVTEHWAFGQYSINFSFGKPQNNIQDQLQLILRKIQTASEKSESTDSVRWYTIPDDSQMPKADVTYRTIGFIGNVGSGATFQLYLDNEKTGAKTYHIRFKQLAGAGKLTLTTGKEGASNLLLNAGTYVAIVYVDENGNITSQGMTATSAVEAGNNQPVTSNGVAQAISQIPSMTVDSELSLTSENPVQNKVITGALNGKQNTLTAGDNIQINGNTISATDTTYSDATQSSAGLMSASDKTKLDGIESGAQVNTVTGVKGNAEADYRTGNVNITKANIGLGSVDNTSDADKPVSTAQATAINNAINALDVASVGGSGKYLSAISETNGKISATAGNISGTVTAGDNAPVSGGAVADILSSLPTDAVLHYSFDDLPDYPDGVAVARYINKNTYEIQNTSCRWAFNEARGINNNGELQVNIDRTSTGSQWVAYLPYTYTEDKICKFVFEITSQSSGHNVQIRNGNNNTIAQYDSVGTYEISFVSKSSYTYPSVYIGSTSQGQATIIFHAIYIGDGSYNTPIIDNANGKWNSVSQSGVAVQGVSGKGYKGFPNKQIQINNFNLNNNFTVSIWVNPENDTSALSGNIFAKAGQFILRNGASWGGGLMLYLYLDNSDENLKTLGNLLTPLQWTHIVITKNGNSLKAYKNGLLIYSDTLDHTNIVQGSDSYYVNGPSNNRPQSYDDLLIFDRALSEKEVLALYYNKANTPKYYSFADYRLDNM